MERLFRSKEWAFLQACWAENANHEPTEKENYAGYLQQAVSIDPHKHPVQYGIKVGLSQAFKDLSRPDYGADFIETLWPPQEQTPKEEEDDG